MSYFDSFTGLYNLSKPLRFGLTVIGEMDI